jgi:hypothetical protein
MSEIVPFPPRMYSPAALADWALTVENAALTRRGSMPTAKLKAITDQLTDTARRLRDELGAWDDDGPREGS